MRSSAKLRFGKEKENKDDHYLGPMLGRRSFLRATGGALALAVGGGALAACAGNKAVASDSSGNRKIRIASPFISTMNSAVLYAQGTGIFAKHNIEASFIQVRWWWQPGVDVGRQHRHGHRVLGHPFAALSQGQKFPIIAQIGNGFPESVFIAKSDWDKSGLKQDSPLEDKMAFLAGKRGASPARRVPRVTWPNTCSNSQDSRQRISN